MNNIYLQSTKLVLLFILIAFLGCKNQNDTTNKQVPTQQPSRINEDSGISESYESTNRYIWQKPDMVIDLLGNLEGRVVADIGAGKGFLARKIVYKAKKVIAVDIDKQFIDYLDSIKLVELPDTLHNRFETRLALANDPKIKKDEVDDIIIVNTYMYISDRLGYLKNLRQKMKNNGKLLIIDFKKKETPIGPPSDIRVPLFEVESELKQAGFSQVLTNDTALDYQYIVIAKF